MNRVRFVAAARREFLAQVARYHMEEPSLGARFATAVETATSRALRFPLSGAMASKNTRRVSVRGFPFALVYRPELDGILIVAVAHHARMPEYWHLRVQEERPAYLASQLSPLTTASGTCAVRPARS